MDDSLEDMKKFLEKWREENFVRISDTNEQNKKVFAKHFNRGPGQQLRIIEPVVVACTKSSTSGNITYNYVFKLRREGANMVWSNIAMHPDDTHTVCLVEHEIALKNNFMNDANDNAEDDEQSDFFDGANGAFPGFFSKTPSNTSSKCPSVQPKTPPSATINSAAINSAAILAETSPDRPQPQDAEEILENIAAAINGIPSPSSNHNPPRQQLQDAPLPDDRFQRKTLVTDLVIFKNIDPSTNNMIEFGFKRVSHTSVLRILYHVYDVNVNGGSSGGNKSTKNLAVIGSFDENNAMKFEPVLVEPTVLDKSTSQLQYTTLAKQINQVSPVLDGSVAEVKKDWIYVKQYLDLFIKPQIHQPVCRLRHEWKMGPVVGPKLQRRIENDPKYKQCNKNDVRPDYMIFANGVAPFFKKNSDQTPSQRVSDAITNDKYAVSWEECEMYVDVAAMRAIYKNSLLEGSVPFIPTTVSKAPLDAKILIIAKRCHGKFYFSRMILTSAKNKISQSFIRKISGQCNGTHCVFVLGPSNCGKTYVIMQAYAMSGIGRGAKKDACALKTKDRTKAGTRRLRDIWAHFGMVFEDFHVAGQQSNMDITETVFDLFSGDAVGVNSATFQGDAAQIVSLTMNICRLKPETYHIEQTINRIIFELWNNEDMDEELTSIEYDDLRDILADIYYATSPYWFNCANRPLKSDQFANFFNQIELARKHYAEQMGISWFASKRLCLFDTWWCVVSMNILRKYFNADEADARELCKWFVQNQIKRSAKFIYAVRLDSSCADFSNGSRYMGNVARRQSTPLQMQAMVYAGLWIVCAALSIKLTDLGTSTSDLPNAEESRMAFQNLLAQDGLFDSQEIMVFQNSNGKCIGIGRNGMRLCAVFSTLMDFLQQNTDFSAIFEIYHAVGTNKPYWKQAVAKMIEHGLVHQNSKPQLGWNGYLTHAPQKQKRHCVLYDEYKRQYELAAILKGKNALAPFIHDLDLFFTNSSKKSTRKRKRSLSRKTPDTMNSSASSASSFCWNQNGSTIQRMSFSGISTPLSENSNEMKSNDNDNAAKVANDDNDDEENVIRETSQTTKVKLNYFEIGTNNNRHANNRRHGLISFFFNIFVNVFNVYLFNHFNFIQNNQQDHHLDHNLVPN